MARRWRPHHYKRRRRTNWYKVIAVLLLIVLIGDVAGFFSLEDIKEKITGTRTTTYQDDSSEEPSFNLVATCRKELEYYRDVSESKYGLKIDVNEVKQVKNREEAQKFLDLWKFSMGHQTLTGDNVLGIFGRSISQFPVVMAAISIHYPDGIAIPTVLGCEYTGKLTENSQKLILGTTLG